MIDDLTLPGPQTGPEAERPKMERALARYRTAQPTYPWDAFQKAVESLDAGGLLPPKITPAKAIPILAKAWELGIPPHQALATIAVVDGRPSLEAKMMLGLAQKHLPSFDYKVLEWTRKVCTVEGRVDASKSPIRVTFDWEDAKCAQLTGKKNWMRYPKAMLFNRAISQLVRALAPGTFSGLYTPEELETGEGSEEWETELVATATIELEPAETPPGNGTEAAVDAEFLPAETELDRICAELREPTIRGDVVRAASQIGLELDRDHPLHSHPLEKLKALQAAVFSRQVVGREPGDESDEI